MINSYNKLSKKMILKILVYTSLIWGFTIQSSRRKKILRSKKNEKEDFYLIVYADDRYRHIETNTHEKFEDFMVRFNQLLKDEGSTKSYENFKGFKDDIVIPKDYPVFMWRFKGKRPIEKIMTITLNGEKKIIDPTSSKDIGFYKLEYNGVRYYGFDEFMSVPIEERIFTKSEFEDDEKYEVFIKTLTGRTETYNVIEKTTIRELKDMITEREGIPHPQIRLLFAGCQLEETGRDGDKTIKDYRINPSSTIHIVLKLRGGGCGVPSFDFMDVGKESKVRLQFSEKAPVWRSVSPGINIEGTCCNSSCVAHRESVFHIVKSSFFNMRSDRAICPMCSSLISVENIGFTGCGYKFFGLRKGEEEYFESKTSVIKRGAYETFMKDDGTKTIGWIELFIIAYSLHNLPWDAIPNN
jgi:hypothetical protein